MFQSEVHGLNHSILNYCGKKCTFTRIYEIRVLFLLDHSSKCSFITTMYALLQTQLHTDITLHSQKFLLFPRVQVPPTMALEVTVF
jgi:hypothetical protein